MAGKGGKGLLAGKTTAAAVAAKEKDKKRPVSSSSRAGLQVFERSLSGSGASPNVVAAAQFVRAEMLQIGYFIRPCKGGGSIIHMVNMLVWISCQAS
ncbi:hypothetical protein ACSBR2_001135 [Camellia fascicularis]